MRKTLKSQQERIDALEEELLFVVSQRERDLVNFQEHLSRVEKAREDDITHKDKVILALDDRLGIAQELIKELQELNKKESARAFKAMDVAEEVSQAMSGASRVHVRMIEQLDTELYQIKRQLIALEKKR